MQETELREIFEEYGEVTSARIITDRYSGRSKGFGFVEMPDEANAKRAIKELNGSEVKGRNIIVNESVEKPERRNFKRNNNGQRRRENLR